VNTKEEVAEFEKLEQQLHSFLDEISELSRKKPNDAVNKFKLKFINTSLESFNKLLADYRPFADFDQFDPDDLPSNSDVVVILSQYAGAADRFRQENTQQSEFDRKWYWTLRGKTSNAVAKSPNGAKYKPK
jgi:hypothetical protein